MAEANLQLQAPASVESAANDALAMLLNPLWTAQCVQWEALLAWQRSLADFQRDLWDQWACRFGGGAPFDA